MSQHKPIPNIYMRNEAGRQVEIPPGYWARRVWADYFKKLAAVAVLGLVVGGLVAHFN